MPFITRENVVLNSSKHPILSSVVHSEWFSSSPSKTAVFMKTKSQMQFEPVDMILSLWSKYFKMK